MTNPISDVAATWKEEWLASPDATINEKDHLNRYKLSVLNHLLEQLPSDASVLEVGCGNSSWLRALGKYHPKLKLFGLDISTDAVAISLRHNISATLGDARSMPYPDNTFDLVFSFGTVEHLPETEKEIWEHLRVLNPKGFAWIETPNRWSLQGLQALFSNFRHHRDPYRLMINQGKWYTHWDLKRMALYAPEGKQFYIQGSGPVLPFSDRLPSWTDSIFDFARRYLGGNAGVVVRKL